MRILLQQQGRVAPSQFTFALVPFHEADRCDTMCCGPLTLAQNDMTRVHASIGGVVAAWRVALAMSVRTREGQVMKKIWLTLLSIFALAVASTQARAQSWPTRPIRAIVPYTAGSGTDVTARVILNQLSGELGQPIVIENRVGAGGTIGTAAAAKADPDGYTILVQSSALTMVTTANCSYRSLQVVQAVRDRPERRLVEVPAAAPHEFVVP